MLAKAKPVRDAFTFSLGGLTAITPFVAAPAIADDLINKIQDEQLFPVRADPKRRLRPWFRRQRQAFEGNCA